VVSLSPIGALGCLVRLALAAALSAAFHSIAVPSTARAQASEPPPSQAEPKPEMREACPGLVAGEILSSKFSDRVRNRSRLEVGLQVVTTPHQGRHSRGPARPA
jgi:hypothetical protein